MFFNQFALLVEKVADPAMTAVLVGLIQNRL